MKAGAFLIVVAALSGPVRAGKPCAIEGKAIEPMVVEVAASGRPPFKLRIEGLPAVVRPPEKDDPARVEVRGAFAFEATAPRDKIPYKPKRAVDSANGMLHLAAGVEGISARARGKWVDAEITLGDVKLRGVTLPCDVLTLDAVASPTIESRERHPDVWEAAVRILHFRHDRGAGPAMEVELDGNLSAHEFNRTETHGGWMRVNSHWGDGTTLIGWVDAKELKKPGTRSTELGDFHPAPPACTREPAPRAGTKTVSATVTPGTQVFAERLIGPWATVKTADKLTVRYRPGDEWVEIIQVPGIASASECATSTVLEEAWVQKKNVQLPPETP